MAVTQNPLEAFIWGAGGSKKTPEEIARDKEIAAELLMKAGNTSPVAHWTQGAARVADALSGVIKQKRAERAGVENETYNSGIISDLLRGKTAAATPSAATSSIPASGASAEMAATSPAVAAVTPSFANDGTELGGYLSDPARRATLPAGMRNNNPGNIKFVGQKIPGIVGPSVNTDQGDPQAVFATPEAGMNAMFQLAKRKYDGGKKTADQLIAGNMGWTPGNHAAAANVAASMGLSPHDDINLNDPNMAAKFVRGLILQEHGKSGALYPESMVLSAIGGQPVQVASAQPQTATDAIEAISPAQGGSLSDEVAAFEQTPAYSAQFPGQQPAEQPAMAAQQPTPVQQVAQALPAAGQAQQANPAMSEALIRAMTDPRATPQTRAVAQALMQQEQAKQQQAAEQQQWMARQQYEAQQRQNDPANQLDMDYKRAQMEALKGKGETLINAGDGRLYNPQTKEWIQAPGASGKAPTIVELFDETTGQPYKATWNAEKNSYERVGGVKAPSGTSLSVGPNGEVQFTQGAGKALTEGQSKDAFFTTRMSAATPTLDAYESALMSLPNAAAGAIPFNLGNYAQSEEYQLARDAGRDFVTAYLRKDSGAALTPAEEKMYGEMLLPQPGDKAATIEAKRTRRAIATEAIKSGMPAAALDNVLKAIKAVPGAEKPAQTTRKKTSSGIEWSLD